jgi:hypothetical protein
MSGCIAGREVVLRFRRRGTEKVWTASVVCPARWTKGRLLAYCRKEHSGETVVIEEWKPVSPGPGGAGWGTRLWIVNPREMVR